MMRAPVRACDVCGPFECKHAHCEFDKASRSWSFNARSTGKTGRDQRPLAEREYRPESLAQTAQRAAMAEIAKRKGSTVAAVREKRHQQAASAQMASARHGRWGGALKVMQRLGGGVTIKGGTFAQESKLARAPVVIPAIDKFRGSAGKETPATDEENFALKVPLLKVLNGGLNELVKATREEIFGKTTVAALRRSNEDAEEWLALVKFFINFHLHTEQLRIETELAAKKDALIVRVIEAETAEAADAESSAWRSRELSPRARVFMLADCEVPLAVRTLRAELMKLELEELRARDKAARQVDGEAMEVADAEMARLHSDDSTRGLWRRSATSCGRRPSTWCCG